MNLKQTITLGIFFLCCSAMVTANNTVEKKTKSGKTISVEVVSEGSVNLYKQEIEVLKPTIPEDPMESYTEIRTVYYVGNSNDETIKELTQTNYKKILLSHLTDKPEVATKIGNKGNKFVNVECIFMAYNEQ
ncbi:MAG: hypothetical protein R2764_22690 [Bacteroidales bacterium]